MNIDRVFDAADRTRTAADWKAILEWAVATLADSLRLPLRATGFTLDPLQPGRSSRDNGADVAADTPTSEGLSLRGCVSCLQNVDENVWIDAEFLAFRDGRRAPEHAQDVLRCSLSRGPDRTARWTSPAWTCDEFGEWESYKDDSRWRG